MNTDLAAQQSIFDQTVALTANMRGKDLIEGILFTASLTAAFTGISGLEVLRIAEQALRSSDCQTEANVIHAHYRQEIEMARND